MLSTTYMKRYNELSEKGYDYFRISKIMKNEAENKQGEFKNPDKLICNCGNQLTKSDFFTEKTDYICKIWYYCKKCNTYPYKFD